MKRVKRLIDHIGLLWTMSSGSAVQDAQPLCGRTAMQEVGAVTDAAIAIDEEGMIAAIGKSKELQTVIDAQTEIIDANNGFVCPGFVDPHTHLVHGGSREHELPMRLAGADYLDILRMGGGIMSTVQMTRECTEQQLYEQAQKSLLRMRSYGVTCVEAKTGYGLTAATEEKQLRVAKALEQKMAMRFVHTALPAHALPLERKDMRERFVKEAAQMYLELSRQGAEFADVFVDDGAFTIEEGRYLLETAKTAGMKIKLHADELVPLGGAELAAELGAVSADHLLVASDEGLEAMAQAGVLAVCLPGTSFYLQKKPARARFMIDEAQLGVALATDYNPGSAPSENFLLMLSLALFTLRMTPEEIFVAATRNAAAAVDRCAVAGVLRPGRAADVVIFDAPNPQYVLTHYGIQHVARVLVKGEVVYSDVQ
ncbi:imidazolonepropionase [Sulfoacidibacillus thermotolerans]|uniref:Imidazolonepropionase n=1 Tax=Sulfoacidibacillus thermotolerans TaxID=1765684 RepID=A0A2U3DCH4_SULT2|nr:imidazolonepropionase [Sulfoacidibacillus thermotolerans]PWI58976.1 imidazolonepropionase [Sulfoacidibacillus thermotolerans]